MNPDSDKNVQRSIIQKFKVGPLNPPKGDKIILHTSLGNPRNFLIRLIRDSDNFLSRKGREKKYAEAAEETPMTNRSSMKSGGSILLGCSSLSSFTDTNHSADKKTHKAKIKTSKEVEDNASGCLSRKGFPARRCFGSFGYP